jgi:shikimate dehydrogenase
MELAGISGTYEPVAVPPAEIVERLPGLLQKYDGLNVTIPYKRLVMPFLDRIDAEAERVGAVNTILREKDGGTAGYNTDLGGFMADGPTLAHRRVLILGSGGVSRTLAYAAGRQGAHHIRFLVTQPGEGPGSGFPSWQGLPHLSG